MEPHASYRMYRLYRVQLLAMFPVFAVVGIFVLAAAIAGHGPPLAFATAWVAIMIWNGYWFLLRIVYVLELAGDRLRWRTPLRSGEVSVRDVVRLRPFKFSSNVEVFELADGTRLTVFVRKGFTAFTEALTAARPGLPVRLGFQARFAEWWPGSSGFGQGRG